MKVNVIKNNAVLSTGESISLDHYRIFLLDRYPQLCAKLFIKLIFSKGKKLATYDWDTIFRLSEESNIHLQFEASCSNSLTSQN